MENIDIERFMEYAWKHSSALPCILDDIERSTHLHTLKPRMLSGKSQGALLRLLVALLQCELIVEVGTFTGYATVCMAEGLPPNGRIHTIEYNPEHAALAKKHFTTYEHAHKIHLHTGAGLDIIPDLPDSIDLAFIDADKDNNESYYEILLPKLKVGGVILIDNVFWSGKVLEPQKDAKTQKIHHFNEKLAIDPRIQTVLLPLRDGLHIIRKK